ncbi:MAG TPA: undecaprenyl-diphosphate phosphatase [Bacillales bacterium]|nr:undecaprenyl-diphosphate phosphatase [Bacillales bacterium]
MDPFYILLKYAFLGLVQGITEPIPISSSGHLIIVEQLLGLKIKGLSFEVFVNTASLAAVLAIYRHDLVRLAANGTKYLVRRDRESENDFLFILYLAIGTIPAAVIGILFNDYIAAHFKTTIHTVGLMLFVTGIALWLIRNLRGRKNDGDLSFKDAVIVGLAQAVALLPGISRSGATIVASMGVGMKQKTALRYSFLLYIPISLGGIMLELPEILNDPNLNRLWVPYTVSFLICFIATYYSLKWLMGIMERGNLGYFTIYCFLAGFFVLFYM